MAQIGFTPISLYYSNTAAAVPLAANLADGELALNAADMKLYAKNNSGTVTLLASNASALTTGTVTSVSVVSANGLAGTVATATTTPAITLSTSITGVLKGDGTAISSATAGTDYVAPGTATTFTAAQSFPASGVLLKGSSTGYTTFASDNASATSYVITFPAATVTVASLTGTETFTNKTITGTKETRVTMAANNIDQSAGNWFTKTISGATTLTVSNTPSSGTASSFILDLTNGGSATITWWSGVKWVGGSAPTLTSSGRDSLGFYTYDGGTTWTGLVLGKDIK